jgi:glycosyltransferase involved in cell wall biosynthesis
MIANDGPGSSVKPISTIDFSGSPESNSDHSDRNFPMLCLFNAYASLAASGGPIPPITGGEKHFVEVLKVWRTLNVNPLILTTKSGRVVCESQGLDGRYEVLPVEGSRLGVIAAYLLRSFQGSLFALTYKGNVCTYSATDILPDVFPAVTLKLLRRKSRMVSWVFHLIPHFTKRSGPRPVNFISYLSQRLSFLLIRRYSDLVIVDNSTVRRDLIALGFDGARIKVVPLGVDKKTIDATLPALGQGYDACFLGRLHRTKGVFDLIEIWRLVMNERKGAKLALIGGDPTGKVLQELKRMLASERMEDSVDLLGWQSIETVFSTLKSSKIFVFPSHEEGWAIAVCEAMTAGLVPVVYDLPAYREFFNEGVVSVEKGDIHAFAEAVIDLLNDEARRNQLRDKAKACASRYSWEMTAMKELDAILNVA